MQHEIPVTQMIQCHALVSVLYPWLYSVLCHCLWGKRRGKKAEKKRRIARKTEKVEVCKERLKKKARHRKVYLGIEKRDVTLQRVQAMFSFLPVKEISSS